MAPPVPKPVTSRREFGVLLQFPNQHLPFPREHGHKSIVVSVVVLDGLIHSSLARHHKARSSLWYDGAELGAESELLKVQEWNLDFKCISHSTSNALAWGLAEALGATDVDDVKIGILSLINSKTGIHEQIPDYVFIHVRFVKDRTGSMMDIRAFWLALGVEDAEMLEHLIAFDLHFDGSFLCIHNIYSKMSLTSCARSELAFPICFAGSLLLARGGVRLGFR